MLIRIQQFVFNIDRINFVNFNDEEKHISIDIDNKNCDFDLKSFDTDYYTTIKEFFLECPDITTKEGKIQYNEKIKVKGKSIRKEKTET